MQHMNLSRPTTRGFKGLLPWMMTTLFLMASSCPLVLAQVSVTTWHNDIGRTGQNLNETILNPSDVNATQFGKLFSHAVDGYVYAQPLYLPNITIGGQSHNVLFVATQHDSVYAFDADNNGGANANPLWFASLLTSAHGAATGATTVSSGAVGTDIVPEVGITGTPVIDQSTGTLYVVSKTQEGSSFVQRLHALDVTSGAEKFGGPVKITATVSGTGNGSIGGTLTFDPEWENQRPSLLLLNGIVYIGYASHGDNGPWHGWLLGYNAATLKQTGAFCATHNGEGAGMWMSGAGLAADQVDPVNHPFGRIFVATGNGDYTASAPYTNNMDFGDSILNLDLTNGNPTIKDLFTPYNQAQLDAYDSDVASGGVMVVPTQTTGSFPNLLVQTGKSGTLYLLNRENLGGYTPAGDQVVQNLTNAVGVNGAWSSPAYWNGNIYYWGVNDKLKVFPLVNGQLTTPPAVSSETSGFPGATPAISANGNSQGIVWAIKTDAYDTQGPAVLIAHDASNPATTLYTSATNPSRDNPGPAVKFSVPTIVNGKVYVGAEYQVSVFGLLNGLQVAAAPMLSPAGESFNGTLTVTMTDATAGATIYYTTDGTTPTVNSLVYTAPIMLTASTTINAMASASGYLQSAITTESYVDTSQVSTPTFSPAPGTFTQPVLVTISDSTTGATIYYTTDGSAPTTSSNVYSGPLTVSASQTINAIAVASGFANSLIANATYTLNIGATGINFPQGFASSQSVMTLNGSSQLNDSRLQLTSGITGQAGSAWFNQQVNIQAFTTEFSFQLSNPAGDGMTFAIQAQNLAALGQPGAGLGYQGIPSSVAIKFDLFSNSGEGPDSTGLYVNGASPTIPSVNLSGTGIDLHSDDTMDVQLDYNGTILSMKITDMVTGATFSTSWTVNIPAIVGGNTAWVGFTGGTGGNTSSQKVLTWTYSVGSNAPPLLTAPTFSPAAGSYAAAQSVTLSDATPGATVYYTTDGTVPTTSSNVYTAPIAVSATGTIQAIAAETGFTTSPVSSATYTIAPALPAPTFSLASGVYSGAESVTISESVPGATIYYTVNGTTPTTSSAVYSGPINVSSTQTISAIAVESGYLNSPVATASYTINASGTIYINYPSNQFSSSGLALNYGAAVTNGVLVLTDGASGENHSAWFAAQVPVQSFITDFNFQQLNANGDGMTFAIQSQGVGANGGNGGGLGYQGITPSVAVKFDLFSNAGEGSNSTGLYTNGASPTLPAIDLSPAGVNLHSGDVMHAHIVYDGTNLTLTITDTLTNVAATEIFPVNIPSIVGSSLAWVGFTGGTGGNTATQDVLSWTYVSPAASAAATPTFSPTPGVYATAQTVTISDATAGAAIYYTTDGTVPTTSSNVYSAPLTISSSQTINAIAVESGFVNSALGTAAYTISSVLPTPTFSPAAGSYSGPQSVTISDSAPGSTIYYTTDGTTPTSSSTLYTGAIAVNASETIKAIAVQAGFTNSAVASAAYTINTVLPAPTFSPAGGVYTSAQSVTVSDATAGTTIYYTTDGTTPTTSSSVYTGAINVNTTESINAIATKAGYANSPVANSVYTINSGGNTYINYPSGGFLTSSFYLNGGPTITTSGVLQVTDGGSGEARSAWYSTKVPVQSFITDFNFQQTNAKADGMTFTIQGQGAGSLGYGGSGLGYQSIPASVAIKFDLYSNAGEGLNSTGAYTNGVAPTVPSIDLTSTGVNLHSADVMHAHMVYDGTNLTMTLTNTMTNISVTEVFPLNIPALVGANTAYVGFTGGTGGGTATQQVLTWTFVSPATPTAATPSFSPAAGTYTTTQSVTVSDATSGATIYYTTDGTTPTTSSSVYSAPITVSTSETVNAIAVKTGYTNSSVGSAVYTIKPVLPTPTFSPAAGSYSTVQSVTISDTTAGTTIYYTTDGSTPTTSSSVYSGPVTVSTTETLNAIAIETGFTNSSVGSATYTLPTVLPTPTFSPAAGTYTTTQSVTISDSTAGTTIYYTTNGAVPTTSSTVYSGPVTVSASQTLSAIAVETGYFNSNVGTAAYTISTILPTPTFSPAAGTYSTTQSVTISDATTGTTIYYTTDGTTPTTSSSVYSSPISVAATETLKAIAVKTGFTNSAVGTAAYSIVPVLPAPTFSLAAGTYTTSKSVTISDTVAGVTIYYTTDGTTPTTSSSVYSGAITVSTSETLSAFAVKTGYTNSPVRSAAYVISPVLPTPTFSPVPGTYTSAQTVTISDSTAGTTIYYTTNGTTPTTSSSVYTGPITVSASETLSAIAVETGYTNSAVAAGAYTISLGSTTLISYPNGGFAASAFYLNGNPTITAGGQLQLTNGGTGQSRSAWYTKKVSVQSFTTDFTFQQLNANADGMTFTIQGQGAGSLGYSGSGLGYQGIPTSVGIKFDLYSNAGEGVDSTGLYTNGAAPTVPSIDLSATGINFRIGDVMRAHIVYDGTNLTMTITDTLTSATVTEVFAVNIPSIVGASTAYVGFTGGTGGATATQNVLSWTYTTP